MTPPILTRSTYFLSAIFGLLIINFDSIAQYEHSYQPRKTYDEHSQALITGVRNQLQDELDRIKSSRRQEIIQIYQSRTNYLISKIKGKKFIEDDSLQGFLNAVFRRIVSNNVLRHPAKRILVLKSPEVNAFCYLDGTLVVNIGLLARVRNESQLAFALAHELAHFELDHLRKRVTHNVEKKVARNVDRQVSKVLDDAVSIGDLDSLRKFVYSIGRYSREAERQADSLGFVLVRRAGYNQEQAIAMLSILDSAEYLKADANKDLFAPLHFSKFPFKDFWLTQRPRIYSKKSTATFIFDNDSLNHHPDMLMRKSILHEQLENTSHPFNYQSEQFISAIITMSEFESVESAYAMRQYDRCLFMSLALLNRYPGNTYLVKKIATLFIDLIRAMDDGTINTIIPQYTSSYSDEFRRVNNFIHNISSEELGELAFHFLNNQTNFCTRCDEHYYLLWQVCHLTHRVAVKEKVKQSYRSRFDEKNTFYNKIK